jgi:hypothetical protein
MRSFFSATSIISFALLDVPRHELFAQHVLAAHKHSMAIGAC